RRDRRIDRDRAAGQQGPPRLARRTARRARAVRADRGPRGARIRRSRGPDLPRRGGAMIPLILLLAVGGMMQAIRSFSGPVAGLELAFGYLLLVAFFTGKIFGRFGLPKLTGYLIAGVISGKYVLSLVTGEMGSSLKIVSDVATCIIALTAGSE